MSANRPIEYIGTEEALKRLLHVRVCPKCLADHGVRDGGADPDQALRCQARCPIFQVLPTLTTYVENLDSLVGSYDGLVDAVAMYCPACEADADWRAEHPSGCKPDCPLRLYRHEMAAVLGEVSRRLHE